jgi:thiol-disulfide isomerase/thioredoxin
MLPRLFLKSHARRIAAALALCALFALACACELDGASKKRAEEARSKAATPMPRTNLPMPPVAASHGVGAGAAPAGAWTQPDGRRVRLEDLRGQVVVLDFWATYCPPCREEIPHLVRLQKRYGPKGFQVIGLNVGGEEDQAKVPEFVKRLDIQYQLGNPDWEFVDAFFGGNSAIPQTLVFDRQGRLVKHLTGYDNEIAAQLEEAVQTALEAKTTTTDE